MLVIVPVTVIAFLELYPFYWIIITAFKTSVQIQQVSSVFWPRPWTLVHFQWLFQKSDFLLWLRIDATRPEGIHISHYERPVVSLLDEVTLDEYF